MWGEGFILYFGKLLMDLSKRVISDFPHDSLWKLLEGTYWLRGFLKSVMMYVLLVGNRDLKRGKNGFNKAKKKKVRISD